MSVEQVFSYRHIAWPGFKKCPCSDPGNYLRMETVDGVDWLECWCGRRLEIKGWDSPAEREAFIEAHKERT